MKATINISSKAIFVVLGIIMLVGLGYFAFGKIFTKPSVIGKSYVSIPTEAISEIRLLNFTEKGTLIEATYSSKNMTWKNDPVLGTYEISGDQIVCTALGGMLSKSITFKWIGKDKFELTEGTKTTTYVLKGSNEDASLINSSILLGKTFIAAMSNTPGYQYESLNFVEDGSIIESFYSEDTKTWKDTSMDAYCVVVGNKVSIYSNDGPEIASFDIQWINKEKFKATNEHGTFIYVLNGSKDAKIEKN